MHVDTKLSICILNGYPRSSRENFDRSNVGHPHDMYADFLRRYAPRASIDVLFVADPDVSLPTGVALESYDAYIWTGSDLTIYHDDPRVTRQIELAQAIYRVGRPMYGSCWGVQMAAVAAGGEVQKMPPETRFPVTEGGCYSVASLLHVSMRYGGVGVGPAELHT